MKVAVLEVQDTWMVTVGGVGPASKATEQELSLCAVHVSVLLGDAGGPATTVTRACGGTLLTTTANPLEHPIAVQARGDDRSHAAGSASMSSAPIPPRA